MARLTFAALASVALLLPGALWAQTFPSKPIRLIIPSAAGGGVDQMTRILATGLSEKLGQPVVPENKGGAGGSVAMDAGAKAAPDGYTLTMVYQSMGANPFIYPKLPFDTVKDFAPVSLATYYQLALIVNNAVPARNVAEYLALAKASPGKLTFGSSGAGAASHLAFEALMSQTGTRFLHVPYKGNAPALTDLLGGQITSLVDAVASIAPHVRAGRVRALGVTSPNRSLLLPEVPSISETVPGYESLGWYGVVAPAGTPPDRVAFLSKAIADVMKEPGVRKRLMEVGNEIVGSTPEEFSKFIGTELRKYEVLVREAGIKVTQ